MTVCDVFKILEALYHSDSPPTFAAHTPISKPQLRLTIVHTSVCVAAGYEHDTTPGTAHQAGARDDERRKRSRRLDIRTKGQNHPKWGFPDEEVLGLIRWPATLLVRIPARGIASVGGFEQCAVLHVRFGLLALFEILLPY